MTENNSFYRKIIYVVLLAVLLFPISYLGAPATVDDDGGKLALVRQEAGLGQSNLGAIDPASETIRMATLGLRGIAVSILWNKANDYKKREDWTNFRATLEQLAKLQPYFISFWKYQAWNLAYNVSVELDDVRDRYSYVTRGIDFLKEGTKYNQFNPHLISELGWFIGNKIGRADERVEYRRLFKADDDFHNRFFDGNPPPPEQRDNWLVSRREYEDSVSVVDDKKKSIGQKNPTTFFAAPAMSQINYAEAIEEDGVFQEKARAAWRTASKLWNDYGNREMQSSRGSLIRLADLNREELVARKLESEFQNLAPGVRDEIVAEKRANLPAEVVAALAVPESIRTEEQQRLAAEADASLDVSMQEIAEQIAKKYPDKAAQANKLANQIAEIQDRIFLIKNNRQVSNYDYWKTRTDFEQTSDALRARELAHAANQAFKEDADLLEARRLYEQSFDLWAKVLDAHPSLEFDSTTGSDLMEYVDKYNEILQQLDLRLSDEEVDASFPLWEIVEASDQERKYFDDIAEHKRRVEGSGQRPEPEADTPIEGDDPVE
ncbi:hypothetical protein [Bythopirellula polymerisocia]|uniref:IRE (Iron responsive element) n=1 Tax=Bythopirellula polymerisocia TaxID=2528003 RepID=A0A5C6CSV6_9BACT|nr:hypothetical protein [Bythopirellula polymerisocia]TWU25829.1 hypothetical protein Pla144_30410 [Bythopirellula polymerisocia]